MSLYNCLVFSQLSSELSTVCRLQLTWRPISGLAWFIIYKHANIYLYYFTIKDSAKSIRVASRKNPGFSTE